MRSVIEASTSGVRDLADGTLRITIDFEPKDAADAFALFGSRGRSVAIAALVDGRKQINADVEDSISTSEEPEKIKGGELSKLAGQWCNRDDFKMFLKEVMFSGGSSPENFIYQYCNIKSRSEIDHDEYAKGQFLIIRKKFMNYLEAVRVND